MANATPVHGKRDEAKKPLSKDAEKIKKELEETAPKVEETPAAPADPVAPGNTHKLPDGTVVKHN